MNTVALKMRMKDPGEFLPAAAVVIPAETGKTAPVIEVDTVALAMKTGTEALPPGAEVHRTGTVVVVHNREMNTGAMKKKMKYPGKQQPEEAGALLMAAVRVPLPGQLKEDEAAIHQMIKVPAAPPEE